MALSVTGGPGPSIFGLNPGQTMSLPIWNAPSGGGAGGAAYGGFGGGGGNLRMGGFDLTNALVQILQQGPQASQTDLTSMMSDISSAESQERKSLSDRWAGMGRPLSSSEYANQEQRLIDTFSRARQAARATAGKTGMAEYQARLNPLLAILRMAQGGNLPGITDWNTMGGGLMGGGGIHG